MEEYCHEQYMLYHIEEYCREQYMLYHIARACDQDDIKIFLVNLVYEYSQ
jgi:hypothetical protein